MEPKHKYRLLALLNYMMHDQKELSHDDFGFFTFHENTYDGCGTMGCMAGELPALFPNDWEFVSDESLILLRSNGQKELHLKSNKDENSGFYSPAQEYFGLTRDEVFHLFAPVQQLPQIDKYYEKHHQLGSFSKKEDVVENLKRFLVIKGLLPEDASLSILRLITLFWYMKQEQEELYHHKFDFSVFGTSYLESVDKAELVVDGEGWKDCKINISCHTAGCMGGELPNCFILDWEYTPGGNANVKHFVSNFDVVLKDKEKEEEAEKNYGEVLKKDYTNYSSYVPSSFVYKAADFFKVNSTTIMHLFYPGLQLAVLDNYYFHNPALNTDATKAEVADNLGRYIINHSYWNDAHVKGISEAIKLHE